MPGALGFGRERFEIPRVVLFRDAATQDMRRFSDQAFIFAKMIGDRDRAEPATAVEINDLCDGLVSVAEAAMNVKISEKHVFTLTVYEGELMSAFG